MSSSNSSFLMGSARRNPQRIAHTVELAVGGVASLEVVAERRVLAVVVLDHV